MYRLCVTVYEKKVLPLGVEEQIINLELKILMIELLLNPISQSAKYGSIFSLPNQKLINR